MLYIREKIEVAQIVATIETILSQAAIYNQELDHLDSFVQQNQAHRDMTLCMSPYLHDFFTQRDQKHEEQRTRLQAELKLCKVLLHKYREILGLLLNDYDFAVLRVNEIATRIGQKVFGIDFASSDISLFPQHKKILETELASSTS